ncbi:MAG: acyl carrier protein [Bdellovibrionales bacterium]|nr:acyl carrier protein [Bdellovibrionales bacterium]MCB0332418.1 acyl carrier protein [Bdellovibrionales bacterium]
MNKETFSKIIEIAKPFAKNKEALESATLESSFLKDLEVSSARLVDIILDLEDAFDVEVEDEEANNVNTVGDAVALIERKLAVAAA